jgi:hypothetical protein
MRGEVQHRAKTMTHAGILASVQITPPGKRHLQRSLAADFSRADCPNNASTALLFFWPGWEISVHKRRDERAGKKSG